MDNRLDIYLIGIDGSTLNSKTIKYDGLHMEQALYEAIDQELKINSSIKGIGISVKAIVCNDGSIRSSLRNNATDDSTWSFEGLSNSLNRYFPNIAIIIENDANCVAELYHIENQLKNENMVAYLLNNNPFGIGIGIIINGTIYKGSFGAAGEFYAHNSHLRDIADDMCGESDFVSNFMPNILSHALATAYLLNPSCIVVTGSYLENLNSISLDLIEQMFSKVPAPVHIAGGTKSLNPAKGVALLATKQYMVEFVEEVVNN